MDQRHVAKPAGKRIHAALSLGKVVRVSPAGSPRGLGKGRETRMMSWVPGERGTRVGNEVGCSGHVLGLWVWPGHHGRPIHVAGEDASTGPDFQPC